MSIATVVTRGYGTFGTVNFLPTLGYGDYGAVTATQNFGNLGFFDIGGEGEGVAEYKAKQSKLRNALLDAVYGPEIEAVAEVLKPYRVDNQPMIGPDVIDGITRDVEAILQRMEAKRRADEDDDEEAILWLM